jgi:WD40 repeat protein
VFSNLLFGPTVWAEGSTRPYAAWANAGLVVQTGHGRSPAAISRAAFSEDGGLLATAAVSDLQIVLWHAGTGKQIRTFVGHTGRVTGLRLNQTDGYLISASADGSVRKWDLATGDEQSRLHNGSEAITAIDQARAANLPCCFP